MNPDVSGWLALANILISGGITVVLFVIGRAVRRHDDAEARAASTIAALGQRLEAATLATIERIERRLEEGDAEIDGLGERDHALELKLMGRIDELKTDLRDSLHQSMRAHEANVGQRIEAIVGRVADVAQAVAVLGDRMGR